MDRKGDGERETVQTMAVAGGREGDVETYESKRPRLYERKTRITGNDNFLSQIFS